jgi:TP901 family phage tail tape measure protein
MSDRTTTVTLKARVDSYVASMQQAKQATAGMSGAAQTDMKKLGGSMVNVGQQMTAGVTLPVLGIGVAAVKMSNSFDEAFARMQGLAGVSAEEVDGLKQAVLGLAGQTAKSPQELAEALYFLRSSGLGAEEALSALEVSAKASSAGLGNTATIADAVSSAMNAYAKSGLSAAEATDILVGTARAGKAEPEQLAGALGRILPIASELGVEFKDVGGAIASLSLTGNDASQSATLLTNVLSKMLKPSQQGAEALAAVGLSTDSIRQSIAEDGLLGTLDMLKSKLGDAGFVRFLEDTQAVQGALALTGQNAEQVATVFDQVGASAGATSAAFAAVDKDGQTMRQAWVDIQVALIQVGDVVGPIVADIAGGIGELASMFSELDPTIQAVVLGIVGFAAAAGPALIALGSLVRNYQTLKTAMAAANIGSAVTPLGALAVAIGVLTTAWMSAKRRADEATRALEEQRRAVKDLAGEMFAAGDPVKVIADNLRDAAVKTPVLTEAMLELGWTFEHVADRASENDHQFQQVRSSLLNAAEMAGATEAELEALKDMLDETLRSANTARTQWEKLNETEELNVEVTGELTDAVVEVGDEIDATAIAVSRMEAEVAALERAYDQFTGKLNDRNAYLRLVEEMDSVAVAAEEAFTAVAEGHDDAAAKSSTHEQAINNFKLGVMDFAMKVEGLPPQRVTEILAEIDSASYQRTVEILNELERTRQATLIIKEKIIPAVTGGFFAGGRALGGPVQAGNVYEVLEGGRSELLTEGNRTFLMAAQDGHVTPLSSSGGGGAGAGMMPAQSFSLVIQAGAIQVGDGATGADIVKSLERYVRSGGLFPTDLRRRLSPV